jgi:hypothetical protein
MQTTVQQPYNGIQRRRQERRQHIDRRQQIRYEPDKAPRRRLENQRSGSEWRVIVLNR